MEAGTDPLKEKVQSLADEGLRIIDAYNLKGMPTRSIEQLLDHLQKRQDDIRLTGKRAEILCKEFVILLMTE